MVEILNQGYDGGVRCLKIGAGDTLQTIFEHPDCPELLRSALSGSTAWQKRNEMKASAALRWSPQWSGVLLALGTRAVSDGAESMLADFLESGVIAKLSELRVPLDVPGRLWGEAHVRRTPTDVPIVSAIAAVDLEGGKVRRARLALCGVWNEAVRLAKSADLLLDAPFQVEAIRKVSAGTRVEVSPKGNYLGDAEYRRAMADVLSRRALEMCMKGENPA